MKNKPRIHGRDHRPGGTDPFTSGSQDEGNVLEADGAGGIRWGAATTPAGVEPWVYATAGIGVDIDTPISTDSTTGEMGYVSHSRWSAWSFAMVRGMGSVFSTPGATTADRIYLVVPAGSYEIRASALMNLYASTLVQKYGWVKLMVQANAWSGGAPGGSLGLFRPGGTQPYRANNYDGGSSTYEHVVVENEFFIHVTGDAAFSIQVWLTDNTIDAIQPGIDVMLLAKRLPDGTL